MNQVIKKRIEDINNGIVPEGYKQTPFGIFPCDWETDKIINDVALCFDGSHETPKYTKEGIPFVSVENIKNIYATNKYISEKDFNEKYKNYPLKNDILMTRIGGIGTPAIVAQDIPIAYYVSLALIRPKNIVSKYLYCAIQGKVVQKSLFEKTLHIAFPKKINLEDIGKCRIVLPKDKNEQSKIAEILMKWDEMVELQEQYIQKLELRKKAIMKKLLTPKDGWEKCRLNELVYKEKGKAVKIDNEGSIPIVDMEYLDKGVFTNYTNEKGVLANEQDILLLWDGASAGTLLTGVKGVVGSTFALLSLKNDKTCSKYLYYWLTIENDKNASLREGSGIPHMPKDYLQKQVVKYPILDKQIKISKTLALLEEEISLQKEKLEKIKIQRKAMQQYLLTGIVRVG